MPKMHIDTIPIWDSFSADCECPLCQLEQACEAQFIDIALGGALMEPDIRVATNESGFCQTHMAKLLQGDNKLGLALMMHTHLKDYMASLGNEIGALNKQMALEKQKNPVSRAAGGVTKGNPFYKQLEATVAHANKRSSSCFICSRIENTMERYLETILHMHKNDEKFKESFAASKGFCMHHFSALLAASQAHLGGLARIEFIEVLLKIQNENLARLEQEIEWFTLKFDYRNADKPWGNSKDAVERTMNKLQGRVVNLDEKKNP